MREAKDGTFRLFLFAFDTLVRFNNLNCMDAGART
jgi:hypothetical protein